MPGLRVLVGSSEDDMKPVTPNDGTAHLVSTSRFEGRVIVYIRYEDQEEHPYFTDTGRASTTWSIQFQGRFLQPVSGDGILMGCMFKKKLELPWGTTAAMQFVRLVDPAIEENLAGDFPWILSPLLAGVPHLQHKSVDVGSNPSSWPAFPPPTPIADDCETLKAPADASGRRQHFASADNRSSVTLNKEDLLTADLCHGHIRFPSMVLHMLREAPGAAHRTRRDVLVCGLRIDAIGWSRFWVNTRQLLRMGCVRPADRYTCPRLGGRRRIVWSIHSTQVAGLQGIWSFVRYTKNLRTRE